MRTGRATFRFRCRTDSGVAKKRQKINTRQTARHLARHLATGGQIQQILNTYSTCRYSYKYKDDKCICVLVCVFDNLIEIHSSVLLVWSQKIVLWAALPSEFMGKQVR